jgi:hypothetical protein
MKRYLTFFGHVNSISIKLADLLRVSGGNLKSPLMSDLAVPRLRDVPLGFFAVMSIAILDRRPFNRILVGVKTWV